MGFFGRAGRGGVKGLELGMAFEVSLSECFCLSATVASSMPPFHTASLFTGADGIPHLAERRAAEYTPEVAG